MSDNSNKCSLIRDVAIFDYDQKLITESKEKNNGKIIMSGILQRSDVVNQNGRVYPKNILEREIRNYQKLIVENRAMGELDHPASSVVELKNVSHVIRDAKIDEEGTVHGQVEILNTPSGQVLQSLIESGIKLGISSRGVGTTKKSGDYDLVQSDFQLICWDFVSEPSTPGAFMLSESKQIDKCELNKIFTKSDKIDRIVNELLDSIDN